jgi:Holliday junction resolvase
MNSKQKGARGEREFSKVCREHGYEARRGQQYNGIEGEDVVGLPGIHIEVKRVERLNIEEAMSQSKTDAQGNIPIVSHRKNNCEWLITMRAEDWFKLFREWELSTRLEVTQ